MYLCIKYESGAFCIIFSYLFIVFQCSMRWSQSIKTIPSHLTQPKSHVTSYTICILPSWCPPPPECCQPLRSRVSGPGPRLWPSHRPSLAPGSGPPLSLSSSPTPVSQSTSIFYPGDYRTDTRQPPGPGLTDRVMGNLCINSSSNHGS